MLVVSQFTVGSRVQYFREADGCWDDGVVEAVRPTGDVQISCEKGFWMEPSEQARLLRADPFDGPPGIIDAAACNSAPESYDVGNAAFDGLVSWSVSHPSYSGVSETRIVTLQPGSIGISYTSASGVITDVDKGGCAEDIGIRKGWRFLALDGQPYSNSLLVSKRGGATAYEVTFASEEQSQLATEAPASTHAVEESWSNRARSLSDGCVGDLNMDSARENSSLASAREAQLVRELSDVLSERAAIQVAFEGELLRGKQDFQIREDLEASLRAARLKLEEQAVDHTSLEEKLKTEIATKNQMYESLVKAEGALSEMDVLRGRAEAAEKRAADATAKATAEASKVKSRERAHDELRAELAKAQRQMRINADVEARLGGAMAQVAQYQATLLKVEGIWPGARLLRDAVGSVAEPQGRVPRARLPT